MGLPPIKSKPQNILSLKRIIVTASWLYAKGQDYVTNKQLKADGKTFRM